MSDSSIHALRFPVGEFVATPSPNAAQRTSWLITIEQFPAQLQALVQGLEAQQLEQTYRPEGWNVKQLVHHCADSHLHAYTRFKLALTEDEPTIKPYAEAAWANLADGQDADLSSSLAMLTGTHQRWVQCMQAMRETDWQRRYFHPEHANPFSLSLALDTYDWHCRHHLAHVKLCLGLA